MAILYVEDHINNFMELLREAIKEIEEAKTPEEKIIILDNYVESVRTRITSIMKLPEYGRPYDHTGRNTMEDFVMSNVKK